MHLHYPITKFKPLIQAMQTDSTCPCIIKREKVMVRLNGVPGTESPQPKGSVKNNFIACTGILLSFLTGQFHQWRMQATRDRSSQHVSSLGKKKSGFPVEEVFAKQSYFSVYGNQMDMRCSPYLGTKGDHGCKGVADFSFHFLPFIRNMQSFGRALKIQSLAVSSMRHLHQLPSTNLGEGYQL